MADACAWGPDNSSRAFIRAGRRDAEITDRAQAGTAYNAEDISPSREAAQGPCRLTPCPATKAGMIAASAAKASMVEVVMDRR